ncbi:saccharopine dehydrogenase family protein [Nostocoides australiense]|nr:saccharopine dehydrogenase NADP-binding domain-containing protein [Tetrasphaera australiensis]
MTKTHPHRNGADILILGATGSVGGSITRSLSGSCPNQIHVGGRDAREVTALARSLGHCAHPVHVDITDDAALRAALTGKSVVINTSSVGFPTVLAAAIEAGAHYVDVSADLEAWGRMLPLHQKALDAGVTAVLGAGLIPGLSNVLAAAAARDVGTVSAIRTGVHLDVRDPHGPGALEYMLAAFDDVHPPAGHDGAGRFRTFERRADIEFPGRIGRRRSYSFPFPGQFHYSRTLGVARASTYLSLGPGILAGLGHLAAVAGLAPLLARPGLSRAVHRWQERLGRPAEARPRPYALVVDAHGTEGRARWSASGTGESRATARIATWFATRILGGHIASGVLLPEQTGASEALLTHLSLDPGAVRIDRQIDVSSSRQEAARWTSQE